MKINIDPAGSATVEFEDEAELNREYQNNIAAGGLYLPTDITLPEFTPLQLTLTLSGAGSITVPAMVVRLLPGAIALAIESEPAKILTSLTVVKGIAIAETRGIALVEPTAPIESDKDEKEEEKNVWDRVRAMSRNEKLMLAPKADRSERAILGQDNDAQVLFYLLKNPRITVEEVVRIARSPLLSANTADLISKNTQWAGSPEIRIALVSNPRTPTPLAMRLLPTLPESEIRQIAKGSAISQTLKQAALKIVINKGSK